MPPVEDSHLSFPLGANANGCVYIVHCDWTSLTFIDSCYDDSPIKRAYENNLPPQGKVEHITVGMAIEDIVFDKTLY